MKDNTKVKGLVVDEYKDRITLSTVDGEKDILHNDIDRIEYDTPEQNYMQLGRAYDEKGWYEKASFYYKKAMEINPDYKEAREAYLASHSRMWHEEEKSAIKELERHVMAMDWWRNRNKKESITPINKAGLLKENLGISVMEKDGIFTIVEVAPNSQAAKQKIEKGDLLVGIWGELIRYSNMDVVFNELLGPKYSEVMIRIEKEISIPVSHGEKNIYKDLGIILGFDYSGLIVKDLMPGKKAYAAGLKKNDYVIAIDKNITRYLPLDSVIALINNPKNNKIVFDIRRNVNLRRGGE